MTFTQEQPIDMGAYTMTPATRVDRHGAFQAAVSIRSGRGSGSHDRVFRFQPSFASREMAHLYAITQGQCWLQDHAAA